MQFFCEIEPIYESILWSALLLTFVSRFSSHSIKGALALQVEEGLLVAAGHDLLDADLRLVDLVCQVHNVAVLPVVDQLFMVDLLKLTRLRLNLHIG